jgi:hypothetical protein
MIEFDEQEDKKRRMIEAMSKLRAERANRRQVEELARRAKPDQSRNLAKGSLDKDSFRVNRTPSDIDLTPEVTKVSGNRVQDTSKEIQKISKPSEAYGKVDNFRNVPKGTSMADNLVTNPNLNKRLKESMVQATQAGDTQMINKLKKIAKGLGKGAKTGLKSVPLIGGLASLAMSENASASNVIPGLDMAESAGPRPGSLEYKMESGQDISPEEQFQLANQRQQPTQEQVESMEEKRKQQRLGALANLSKS